MALRILSQYGRNPFDNLHAFHGLVVDATKEAENSQRVSYRKLARLRDTRIMDGIAREQDSRAEIKKWK